MYSEEMRILGAKRSVIRDLFEYGKKREKEIGKGNVFDFSLGNPSVPPPARVRECIESSLNARSAIELHGYTSSQGDAETREAIAQDLRARLGSRVSADDIYMTAGAAAALAISLKALCEPNDEFAIFAPYFPEYPVFIRNAGGTPIAIPPTDDMGLNLAELEKRMNPRVKAVIVNSPNNPSGAVYSRATMQALAAILGNFEAKFGHPIFIISDEPYREITYGAPVPNVMSLHRNSIVCYSYSKSMSIPGERIGYIALSPECDANRDAYCAICGAGRSQGYVCAPALFQRVAAQCVGETSDIKPYAENRKILCDALESFGYSFRRPDGAFYLFAKTPNPDAIEFAEKAKEFDILIVPSDSFGVRGYVRIAYCVPKEAIVRALPAFKKLAEAYGICPTESAR